MNRPPIRRALTAAVACALLVAAGGCNSKRSSTTLKAGGANTEKAEKARKMAQALAVEAVRGGAEEQAKLPAFAKGGSGGILAKAAANAVVAKLPPVSRPTPKPAPSPLAKVPPRPTSPVVISDRVSSSVPYTSLVEADEDALVQAQERVEQRLRELRPPVSVRPSLDVVRREYVRRDTRTVRHPDEQEKLLLVNTGYSGERVYVEYEVQVTADQVRELRTQDRIGDALRVMGVLTAAALAAFLFLRLDEWTKGYLTSRLAVAAVLLATAVAAVAVFV